MANSNSRNSSGISFFSEHTAEYALVPNLINLLSSHFKTIVPFFYWSSREGNSMSRWCGENQLIRLIVVFPRRPKISNPRQDEILVKFNDSLFEVAELSKPKNIPVFAGVPLVSSIFDFSINSSCAWFYINTSNPHHSLSQLSIKLNNPFKPKLDSKNNVVGPLEAEEIVGYINKNSQSITWKDALNEIRGIKFEARSGDFFGGFGGYKPFYLAILDKQ